MNTIKLIPESLFKIYDSTMELGIKGSASVLIYTVGQVAKTIFFTFKSHINLKTQGPYFVAITLISGVAACMKYGYKECAASLKNTICKTIKVAFILGTYITLGYLSPYVLIISTVAGSAFPDFFMKATSNVCGAIFQRKGLVPRESESRICNIWFDLERFFHRVTPMAVGGLMTLLAGGVVGTQAVAVLAGLRLGAYAAKDSRTSDEARMAQPLSA